MLLYLFIILVILFLRLILSEYTNPVLYKRSEKIYCTLIYIVLIFVSAFRADSVGTDTLSYINDYAGLGTLSLSDVIEQYEDYEGFYVFSLPYSNSSNCNNKNQQKY